MGNGVNPVGTPPFYGLVAYGPSTAGLIRSSASYVAAILKGSEPSQLPVEQPSVFDFGVNLDLAQQLGLTIAPSVLAQATVVVRGGRVQ